MSEEKININLSDQSKPFHEQLDEVRALSEESLHYVKALYQAKAEGLGKDEPDLRQLVQENLNLSHEIFRLVKKIRSQLFWQKIFGLFKLLIIVVPIVVATIYFYPTLVKMMETYQQLMNMTQSASSLDPSKINLDVSSLSPEALQNLLKQIKK